MHESLGARCTRTGENWYLLKHTTQNTGAIGSARLWHACVHAKSLQLCLFVTPWTVAHQTLLFIWFPMCSLRQHIYIWFPRQEHWSGLSFPSPCCGIFRTQRGQDPNIKNIHVPPFWASKVVLMVKRPPAHAGDIRDLGLILGLGRSPGGGHSNPLQYSGLENPPFWIKFWTGN